MALDRSIAWYTGRCPRQVVGTRSALDDRGHTNFDGPVEIGAPVQSSGGDSVDLRISDWAQSSRTCSVRG